MGEMLWVLVLMIKIGSGNSTVVIDMPSAAVCEREGKIAREGSRVWGYICLSREQVRATP